MNNDKGFCKYQVSRMDGEYQVVYRTDDVEEFADMLAGIKKLEIKPVSKGYTSSSTDAPFKNNVTADDFADKDLCPVHGVSMETKVSKKTNKPYKFHDGVEGKCFGKGFMPPKF